MKASPLATCITASVAMNGGTLHPATMAPENSPTAAHTATPASEHHTCAAAVAATPPASSRSSLLTSTALSAMRLPTDRSMPPVKITTLMPAARIATTAIWLATFNRFCRVRNVGQRWLSASRMGGEPRTGKRSWRFCSTVQLAHSAVVAR